jgi:hypothetical protein
MYREPGTVENRCYFFLKSIAHEYCLIDFRAHIRIPIKQCRFQPLQSPHSDNHGLDHHARTKIVPCMSEVNSVLTIRANETTAKRASSRSSEVLEGDGIMCRVASLDPGIGSSCCSCSKYKRFADRMFCKCLVCGREVVVQTGFVSSTTVTVLLGATRQESNSRRL